MTLSALTKFLLGLGLVAWPAAGGFAWEIQLKERVTLQSALVRLGDVAAVSGLDEQSLATVRQLTLAPGPTPSRSRVVSAGQVRALLERHGVEVGQCRFSGAPRVVVTAGSDPHPAAADGPAAADCTATVVRTGHGISATRATAERAQQSVLDALRRQLSPPGQPEVAWDVDVSLSHRAVASLPDRWRDVTIESLPRSPEGTVQCQAVFAGENDVVRIPVEARVHRLQQVVVPVRKLEKGQLVRSDDVEVRLVRQRDESDRVVQRVEDAVGRQARQAVLPGLVLDDSLLQNPLLVKRRDVVDVVARRGGVTVRRPMTAMEDGAQGDMITVESLDGLKTRLIARVAGPLSAEVFVSSSAIGPRTENRVATDR